MGGLGSTKRLNVHAYKTAICKLHQCETRPYCTIAHHHHHHHHHHNGRNWRPLTLLKCIDKTVSTIVITQKIIYVKNDNWKLKINTKTTQIKFSRLMMKRYLVCYLFIINRLKSCYNSMWKTVQYTDNSVRKIVWWHQTVQWRLYSLSWLYFFNTYLSRFYIHCFSFFHIIIIIIIIIITEGTVLVFRIIVDTCIAGPVWSVVGLALNT